VSVTRASGLGAAPAPHGLVVDGGRPPSNSYVLPEHKIVYISVTKVACTSLRWMLADLAGEDPSSFVEMNGYHLTRLMTVHDIRARWSIVRRLSDMSPDEVEQVSVDNGWFIFAMVRDPWSRLWSAWESKLLTRHPGFVRWYADEPWFPRVPRSSEEVVEDFRTFVEAHPWTSHPRLSKDSHFWDQVRSVRPDGLEYSGIYDISTMSRLVADLHAHLAGIGKDKPELYMPRANETPLALTADVLADGVAERIEELYERDFARFGERWSRESRRLAPSWTSDALRAVDFQGQVNQRLGDLARRSRSMRKELERTQSALQRTRSRLEESEAARTRLESTLPVRARRRLGAVRRRLRSAAGRADGG
jgi:hypothetical protein